MNHIKTFNELLKSTYSSAASGLRPNHKKRADELIKHANKHGKDVIHDRIYPHRFIFDNTHPSEYFFITGYSYRINKNGGSNYLCFNVNLSSNWGNIKKFTLVFEIYDEGIEFTRISTATFSSDRFENEDSLVARKNANHMIKFFKECWEDDIIKEHPEFVSVEKLSPNKLYRSE